jgi:acyl-CoA thioesterase-1
MNDLRICFVGDSYMNGSGDLELLGWVRRLCRKRYTADRRFTFYELGIRGSTSTDVKSRWESECRVRLPEGTDNRVVLQFGLNDVAEIQGSGVRVEHDESVQNAREIATGVSGLYRTLWVGQPPVNVPCSPMTPSPGFVITFDQDRAITLNEAYRSVAEDLGVPYLDILTPLLAYPEYWAGLTRSDRMHCDERGYDIMAGLVDGWPAWNDWFS